MFYAERIGDGKTEPYIAERGVFLTISEFVPYRRKGWSGTAQTDALADQAIKDADDLAASSCWYCCRADFGEHEETCPNYELTENR